MSTNVKRATRKGLLLDYYSILEIIFNIIHVFFSKTFFVLFCFPSNMAAKYAVRRGVTSCESGLYIMSPKDGIQKKVLKHKTTFQAPERFENGAQKSQLAVAFIQRQSKIV